MRNGFVASLVVVMAVLAPIPSYGQTAQAIPRTAEGKPDFTGVYAGPAYRSWQTGTIARNDTDNAGITIYDRKRMSPFKPGGFEIMSRPFTGDPLKDDPTEVCLPNGLTRQFMSPYAQQWVQHKDVIVNITEYMHFVRSIPIGAPNRPHDPNVELTWMGDSIGWWEGDTLVIDTIGLKEWHLDATINGGNNVPADERGKQRWHTDQLHVVERLKYKSPTDPRFLSYEIIIDDPGIFTKPWSQEFGFTRHPTWKLLEYVCEENNRCIGGNCPANE